MKRTATAKEIALATGKHQSTVTRKLKSLNCLFTWRKGTGGNERQYFNSLLPEEYRLALASHDVTPIAADPVSFDERVGAEAARGILVKRAEEQELAQIAKEDGLATFDQLPEQRKNEARGRFSFLQMADGFVTAAGYTIRRYAKRSKVGDKAFIEAYNSGKIQIPENVLAIIGKKSSYSTLKRIADTYGKYGVAGLAFNYHNPKRGSTELTEEQQDFVIAVMCQSPDTSNRNIRRALQGKFKSLDVPSVNVIGRYRDRWITDNADLWLFYTNPDAWKSKKMMAYGSASAHIERLNQLWEADSTPADLMLNDGRHSIIGMIDVYSRRLRFFVSKTSRSVSVVALIRHSLIEWGVPEIIKTDNGKDYVSKHVTRVMHGLDIDQQLCTPFQGQEKPHIERAFKTFLHGLVEMKSNYIGHNVTDRKAIEARRSFADRIMDKESDPVELSMSSNELQKFCDEWTNFIYQYDEHGGLDSKRPIDMVRGWKEPIRRIHNLRALDMLLMEAPTDGGIRTITKKGIRVENRHFQSPEFAGLVGEKVYVLLDPADLGQVFIYHQNEHGERSFLCPAIDPVWSGIDPAAFAVMSRKHQDKIMREGSRELKKLSKEQGVQEALSDYVDLRKSHVENIIELPLKSKEHTTAALDEGAKAVDAVDYLKDQESGYNDIAFTLPAEPVIPAKQEKVVVLRSDSDQYIELRTQIKSQNRKLSQTEHDWLGWFYEKSPSGSMYMSLEGDMRLKVGKAVETQAEG